MSLLGRACWRYLRVLRTITIVEQLQRVSDRPLFPARSAPLHSCAAKFFRFVVECAGNEGTRAAELYHWSAMTFGEHWRRLVAVELGRGRVLCLRRAADRGYGGNTVPSAETAPDSL